MQASRHLRLGSALFLFPLNDRQSSSRRRRANQLSACVCQLASRASRGLFGREGDSEKCLRGPGESVSPVTPSGYTRIELYLPQEPSSDEQCVYILCPLPVIRLFIRCFFLEVADLDRPSAQFLHSEQKTSIVDSGGRSRAIEVG